MTVVVKYGRNLNLKFDKTCDIYMGIRWNRILKVGKRERGGGKGLNDYQVTTGNHHTGIQFTLIYPKFDICDRLKCPE